MVVDILVTRFALTRLTIFRGMVIVSTTGIRRYCGRQWIRRRSDRVPRRDVGGAGSRARARAPLDAGRLSAEKERALDALRDRS
jgi:hypothetical protein